MKKNLERSISIRYLEYCYAVVLLFTLTQGPVYRAWYASGRSTALVPFPSISLAHYATFLAMQIPALMILGRRLNPRTLENRQGISFLLLLAWVLLSTLWSVLSRQTLVEAVAFTVTALCGLYLAVSFSSLMRLVVTFVAMQIGVVVSLVSILDNWELSTSGDEGYWIGIYLNRNSLAPVAAIGLLAGWFLFFSLSDTSCRATWRKIAAVICAAFVVVDVLAIWQSQSTTSPVALAVVFAGATYWYLLRFISRSRVGSPLVRYSTAIFFICVSIGLGLIFAFQKRLLSIIGESSDFNGRVAHWKFSWNGVLDHPVLGYGWQAAWRDPSFLSGSEWWTLPNLIRTVDSSGSESVFVDPSKSWSHSAYFDLLLGGGTVAFVLFLLLIGSAISIQRGKILYQKESLFGLSILLFVTVASSQESFLIGNHFLWMLLASVLWQSNSVSENDRWSNSA